MRTHLTLTIIGSALLLVAPLAASAEILPTITSGPSTNAGQVEYDGPTTDFMGQIFSANGNFANAVYGKFAASVIADAWAKGAMGTPNKFQNPTNCLNRWAYPSTLACAQGNGFDTGYPNGFYVCSNGAGSNCGLTGPPTTAQRLCEIQNIQRENQLGLPVDPTIQQTRVDRVTYGGNGDQNTLTFDGTRWFLNEAAPTFYIPNYVGTSQAVPGDINDTISALQCTSDQLPNPFLSADTYGPVTPGAPVTISWVDKQIADSFNKTVNGITEPITANCTATNFTLTGQTFANVCDVATKGLLYCFNNPTPVLKSAVKGNAIVNPMATTIYKYRCTNPNGWAEASVRVFVGPAAPDIVPEPLSGANLTLPALPTAGAAVNIGANFKNQGNLSTVSSFPDLFEFYPGFTPPADFTELTTNGSVAAVTSSVLASLATGPVTLVGHVFPFSGVWQVRACGNTDASGNHPISEGDSSNNCGNWTPELVSGPPMADLQIFSQTIPVAVVAGTVTPLTATVKNFGGAATSGNFPDIFEIDGTGTPASFAAISAIVAQSPGPGALAALASNSTSGITYNFPIAGTWYVRACANLDPITGNTVVAESITTNNCGAWTPVVVTPAAATTATFTATPTSVPSGGSSTLTWTSNATSCTSPDFATGNAANNLIGVSTGPIVANTTYHLTCTGPGGSVTKTAVVTITGGACVGPPTPTISASASRVSAGTSVVIHWSATGVSSQCVISGPGGTIATVPASGACTVSDSGGSTQLINTQSTFTITCDGNIATRQGVTVNIIPTIIEY